MSAKSSPGVETMPPPNANRHVTLYLDQIIFRIDNTLYGIPTAFLRQSSFFSSMLDNVHTGDSSEGVDDNHPIVHSAVTATEMDSFLAIVDSRYVRTLSTPWSTGPYKAFHSSVASTDSLNSPSSSGLLPYNLRPRGTVTLRGDLDRHPFL